MRLVEVRSERVWDELDVPCYGKEVLERAAERMQTVPERLIHLEESTSNSLLFSLWHGKPRGTW